MRFPVNLGGPLLCSLISCMVLGGVSCRNQKAGVSNTVLTMRNYIYIYI